MEQNSSLKSRFDELDGRRNSHLQRCRDCASVTIPHLLPPNGADENTVLPTPYQGLGARAVNNLSAKLLLALFPPNTSFFRLDVDEFVADQLKEEMGEEDFKTKISSKIRKVERIATKSFEAMAHRTQMFKGVRLLVVTGNALLEQLPSGKIKVYRLDKYVVRRNPAGEPVEIIIQEMIYKDDVPEEILRDPEAVAPSTSPSTDKDVIPLLTQAILKNDRWHVQQEVMGLTVPGSEANYPKDKTPFIPLTWTLSEGENYGRGHVEEYLGDVVSYDELSKDLLEGAAAAAKLIFLVKASATTNIADLRKARNGQFVQGDEEDIGVLRVDKLADFKTAYEQANEVAMRLSKAFLLTESVQRQAERVTAEEVRLMAQELEDSLGGVYSVLGVELQSPLAKLMIQNLTKRKKMPPLPKEVDITITTGFEALGRGHDLARLREFRDEIVALGQASGQADIVTTYLKVTNYLTQVASAIGLDTDELVPNDDDLKKAQQQKEQYGQIMEMANSKVGGELVKGAMQGGIPQNGQG